ncbi:MAG: fumarate hydratase [Peptococcaceae bacterium]|nr:fumarate hydratase [Peptococcaceae bacterium]MDH7526437.1 fumarate hydratase [Peptococcaceae bacterium]
MKDIHVDQIVDAVESICIKAACDLDRDVEEYIKKWQWKEESEFGKYIFEQILENIAYARRENIAMCQDTGAAVIFLEIGQEVHIVGGSLREAIDEGVRRGYKNGYLRNSMVDDPVFRRKNTGDNTPAVVHTEIVAGDKLKIMVLPKGGGSENMGALKMLRPSDGIQGIKDFVLKTVVEAGGNPCPPVIVGVGIGGTMEMTTLLAKKALARKIGQPHRDPEYARLEKELLEEINRTGIGPQGIGGRVTALAVHIEHYPTHITSLPVAVNLNCHASRHAEAVL